MYQSCILFFELFLMYCHNQHLSEKPQLVLQILARQHEKTSMLWQPFKKFGVHMAAYSSDIASDVWSARIIRFSVLILSFNCNEFFPVISPQISFYRIINKENSTTSLPEIRFPLFFMRDKPFSPIKKIIRKCRIIVIRPLFSHIIRFSDLFFIEDSS